MDIRSTPAGGGGTSTTTTPSTVTVNERNRQHADEEQYDDDDSDSNDDDDADDDYDYGIQLAEVQKKNESSELQNEGFITLQVQSDFNNNSINLNEDPDNTPLGQLAVNFKRFNIFLFI